MRSWRNQTVTSLHRHQIDQVSVTSFSTLCACGFDWPKAFDVITAMQVGLLRNAVGKKWPKNPWVLGRKLEKSRSYRKLLPCSLQAN